VTAIRSTARVEDLPTDLSLTPRERRVVARLLGWLRDDLGRDLLAVWLFGSRARGEADLAELDQGGGAAAAEHDQADHGAAFLAPAAGHHRQPFAPCQPNFVPGKPAECGG